MRSVKLICVGLSRTWKKYEIIRRRWHAASNDKSILILFRKMWFFAIVFAMVGLYISGRKWGPKLFFYYRPRLPYILPYRKKPRSLTPPPTLNIVESDLDAAKKKFDPPVIKNKKTKISFE